MTSDIRDRMGDFKLTRGSLVIAVERWLKDLAVDYAKMDEASRHKEAEIYVGEFLTAPSPCAFCRGLGYIVNPDDLKRVPCYCQETCACGGAKVLATRTGSIYRYKVPGLVIKLDSVFIYDDDCRLKEGESCPVRVIVLEEKPCS